VEDIVESFEKRAVLHLAQDTRWQPSEQWATRGTAYLFICCSFLIWHTILIISDI